MTNLGAHELDIVHWVMQVKAPQAVASSGGRFALTDNGETPDTQDAMFEYPGFIALWTHREASWGRGEGQGLEFFGSKGSMTLSRSAYQVFPDPRRFRPKTRFRRISAIRRAARGGRRI